MFFCPKCGARIMDGARFCFNCGAPIDASNQKTINFFKKIRKALDDSDVTHQFAQDDIERNKDKAVVSYASFIAIFPATTSAEDSPFVRFHANQGLWLAISEILLLVLIVGEKFLFDYLLQSGYPNLLLLLLIMIRRILYSISSIQFIVSLIGICNMSSGKAYRLPFLSKFDILGKFYK